MNAPFQNFLLPHMSLSKLFKFFNHLRRDFSFSEHNFLYWPDGGLPKERIEKRREKMEVTVELKFSKLHFPGYYSHLKYVVTKADF